MGIGEQGKGLGGWELGWPLPLASWVKAGTTLPCGPLGRLEREDWWTATLPRRQGQHTRGEGSPGQRLAVWALRVLGVSPGCQIQQCPPRLPTHSSALWRRPRDWDWQEEGWAMKTARSNTTSQVSGVKRHQTTCTPTRERARAGLSTAHHSVKAASYRQRTAAMCPQGSQACSSSDRETAHARTHGHAHRKMAAPRFPASPARTQPTATWSCPRPAWRDCSGGNHAHRPLLPSYPLLWATGGTKPHTAMQSRPKQPGTARGLREAWDGHAHLHSRRSGPLRS